ncbi:MAG: type II toxin-antitoxin system Phd/YefM family antitoxin [Pseudomonadota bacterium]
MQTFNIHEAKTNFSKLIDTVISGNEVVIAKSGKPVARLVAICLREKTRKPGAMKGKIRIAEDFDAPLPDNFLAAFQSR